MFTCVICRRFVATSAQLPATTSRSILSGLNGSQWRKRAKSILVMVVVTFVSLSILQSVADVALYANMTPDNVNENSVFKPPKISSSKSSIVAIYSSKLLGRFTWLIQQWNVKQSSLVLRKKSEFRVETFRHNRSVQNLVQKLDKEI